MSCKHGNWAPCELCDEVDEAWNNGHAAALRELGLIDGETIDDFKRAYALLFSENAKLRDQLAQLQSSESHDPCKGANCKKTRHNEEHSQECLDQAAVIQGWGSDLIAHITSVLASEIECEIFETHVQPALDIAFGKSTA